MVTQQEEFVQWKAVVSLIKVVVFWVTVSRSRCTKKEACGRTERRVIITAESERRLLKKHQGRVF
jgi:hypothetical protein